MKSLRILFVVLLGCVLFQSTASAVDLGVFGSYWDTKDADQTYGAGAKLRLGLIELRATYFKDVTADVEPEALDFEISALPLEAGLVFRFLKNAPFSPYVGGGGGYYILDTNRGEIDDEAGYYLVGGADIGRGMVVFNIEAIYRNFEATVVDTGDDFPELERDVHFDLGGIGVNAGVVFRF
jgi:hypothetical protein